MGSTPDVPPVASPDASDMDDPVAALKQAHRTVWAAGDFGKVAARLVAEVPPSHLLARMDLEVGMEVLDVATGTGNVAVRAAAGGCRVTGLDLTARLLVDAAIRARRLGVSVDWVQGDAEDLPFPSDHFDRVLSTFGVQFAPRHRVAAHELARVCAPGGRIGIVNWTPDGQIGRLFEIVGRYLPAPPDFASPPPLWGSEEHVRDLFDGTGVELSFEPGCNPLRMPSADAYVEFMERHYGPLVTARARLEPEGRWRDCRAELVALMEELDLGDEDGMHVEAEYVLIAGRKPAARVDRRE